jgi:hypothetical protein
LSIRLDSSAWFLIGTNFLTIFLAISQHWNFANVLFLFWCQSAIIGLFSFFKIISLKNFTTDNFKISGESVEATLETKRKSAFIFLITYGFFHFVYFVFLSFMVFSKIEWSKFLLFGIALFFVNHLFSFIVNYKRESNRIF